MRSSRTMRMKTLTRKNTVLNPKESRYKGASFFMKDEASQPYGMGELRSRMEWLAGWYDAKVETQGFDDVKSKRQ